MAYSRGFDLSQFSDGALHQIARQVASLNREGGHLTSALRHYGRDAGHDIGHLAHDLADTAVHQGAIAARVVGKQAWKAGKAVGRDPAPAVAAVVGLACLLSLALSSGSGRRRR